MKTKGLKVVYQCYGIVWLLLLLALGEIAGRNVGASYSSPDAGSKPIANLDAEFT